MSISPSRAILGAGVGVALVSMQAPARAEAPARTAARPGACAPWHVRTLLRDQGWLENLAFDGRGGMTISALGQNRLLRLTRKGRRTTLLSPVRAPGGERRRGHVLYFNTGNTVPLAPNGTVDRLDLRTGRRTTWARGLTMPNGLIFLPNGDAVVSRDLGSGTSLTRIRARDPRHPQTNWAKLDDTNGMAVSPSGRWLYVARTFTPDGEIDRVSIAHPSRIRAIARLGRNSAPDDMAVDRAGTLFVAGFVSGKIHRVNPATGRSCAIASGLGQPTSPRFGGAGWNAKHLHVTEASGSLVELTPPN